MIEDSGSWDRIKLESIPWSLIGEWIGNQFFSLALTSSLETVLKVKRRKKWKLEWNSFLLFTRWKEEGEDQTQYVLKKICFRFCLKLLFLIIHFISLFVSFLSFFFPVILTDLLSCSLERKKQKETVIERDGNSIEDRSRGLREQIKLWWSWESLWEERERER